MLDFKYGKFQVSLQYRALQDVLEYEDEPQFIFDYTTSRKKCNIINKIRNQDEESWQ